ncbi:D-alanyl-D-alanine carboxypeptidase / D-alanyl-D-alanine-endopeptidase (penicillin-binding protein 4) [Micromonospora inyonensis]|uniref:D-alanyl-D-alanine carboxypeptidase / D-alanyl-D-alanine-endopeptidase (Penicillin-binding protein 4) n=1 Tax=Micromonospora inyonensis TaxID=47866 RepID=A0A1C6RCK9_9ACTN|nr:D-alanyl-D-alanine carboxypeptidase / D-alanyl-D-alanine-endopeptidase (penicillin-binding protein 4) [Micromonospora inyonensis]
MGREDSHYRPGGDRAPGRPERVTGRVVVPGAHGPAQVSPTPVDDRPRADAPGTGRPPPPVYRPPARPADTTPAVHPARPADPAPSAHPAVPVAPGVPAAAGSPPPGPSVAPPTAPQGPPPDGATTPRRRRTLLTVLAAVLLLVVVGTGLVVVRPGPVAGWLGGDAGPTADAREPEAAPVPVLGLPSGTAPVPTPEGVRAALDPLVGAAGLGSRVNVSVTDVTTGQELYGRGADDGTVPASVTKLVTGVTVLAARGPAYRIGTRAVAGATPGEVVLVGGGDPTLAIDANGFYPGAARLDVLAEQVKQALGGTPPTKVTVDSTLFPGPVYEPGWDADIPTGGYGAAITALMTDGARVDPDAGSKGAERYRTPDLTAGRAFARLLGLPAGTKVERGGAPGGGSAGPAGAPAPGTELGRVESPPLIRLVDIMITDSDNVVAEALARQVALARNQPASFVGAGAAMDQVAAELGLPADELALADGSGLSRTNRISPSLLTDLIALAGNGTRPELAGIFGGLPVGGWSGTLDDRYATTATRAGAGVVRAKTGTLTGVHAIAGLVTTADGRLLSFAVLTDRTPPTTPDATRLALDRIGAALAGCGCR